MTPRHARRRPTLRRSLSAAAAGLAVIAGFIAVAPSATAAGPWHVKPASAGGNNGANCLSPATACATIAGVLVKPGFVNGDTINVAAGTYVSQTTFAAKGANVVGSGTVILDGNNAGALPVIAVNGAITVNLTNLTIRNGPSTIYSGGLGVVAGTVNTTDVILRDNRGIAGAGAIVAQGATLNMTGGSITNNTATATAQLVGAGGGVYVYGKVGATPAGKLTLDGVAVTDNVANGANFLFTGNGGGIFNAGTTVVKNSTFSGNRAVASTANVLRSGQGGAIFNGANDTDDVPDLTVQNTTITGGLAANTLNATSGGAIANVETSLGGTSVSGALTMTGTTLRGNQAVVGGGLYNGGTVNATGGLVENNTAYSGGGVYQSPIVLATANPTSTFDGTAFTGNTANGQAVANFGNGGAIFNGEKLTVRNATFTGNKAVASSAASTLSGWGGAIFNGAYAAGDAPDLTVEDSTIDGGTIAANAVIGGAIASTSNVLGVSGGVPAKLALTRTTSPATWRRHRRRRLHRWSDDDHRRLARPQLRHQRLPRLRRRAVRRARPPPQRPRSTCHARQRRRHGQRRRRRRWWSRDPRQGHRRGAATAPRSTTTPRRSARAASTTPATLTIPNSDVSGNDAGFQAGGIYNGSTVAHRHAQAPRSPTPRSTTTPRPTAAAASPPSRARPSRRPAATSTATAPSAAAGSWSGTARPAVFDGTDFVGNIASASGGGAILNSGTLSVANSMLTGNEAVQTTGNTGLGGAIYSGSNTANAVTSLDLEGEHVAGNKAFAASALLTFSPGAARRTRPRSTGSTITGNSTTSTIGAIEQFHPLTITVQHDHRQHQRRGQRRARPGGPGLRGRRRHDPRRQHRQRVQRRGRRRRLQPRPTPAARAVASPRPTTTSSATRSSGPSPATVGGTDTRLPGPASPALDKIPTAPHQDKRSPARRARSAAPAPSTSAASRAPRARSATSARSRWSRSPRP